MKTGSKNMWNEPMDTYVLRNSSFRWWTQYTLRKRPINEIFQWNKTITRIGFETSQMVDSEGGDGRWPGGGSRGRSAKILPTLRQGRWKDAIVESRQVRDERSNYWMTFKLLNGIFDRKRQLWGGGGRLVRWMIYGIQCITVTRYCMLGRWWSGEMLTGGR